MHGPVVNAPTHGYQADVCCDQYYGVVRRGNIRIFIYFNINTRYCDVEYTK